MIHFEITVKVDAPQQFVWERLTDWESHSQWIPFTKVFITQTSQDGTGVGTGFTGRTGIGVFFFDDKMTVVRCVSPHISQEDGKCWISKNSEKLKGNAYFHVVKLEDNTSEIVWGENIILKNTFLTRAIAPFISWAGSLAFRFSLQRFAKITERAHRGSAA